MPPFTGCYALQYVPLNFNPSSIVFLEKTNNLNCSSLSVFLFYSSFKLVTDMPVSLLLIKYGPHLIERCCSVRHKGSSEGFLLCFLLFRYYFLDVTSFSLPSLLAVLSHMHPAPISQVFPFQHKNVSPFNLYLKCNCFPGASHCASPLVRSLSQPIDVFSEFTSPKDKPRSKNLPS